MNKSTCLGVVLASALAACGGGGGGGPSGPGQNTPPPTTIASTTSPKPTVDFAKIVLSRYAGSYTGGQCYGDSGRTSLAETMQITGDGVVNFAGASDNNFPELSITRIVGTPGDSILFSGESHAGPGGGQRTSEFFVSEHISAIEENNMAFILMRSPALSTSSTYQCSSKGASYKLSRLPIYPLIAKYIEAPGNTFSCRYSNSNATVSYSLLDGVFQINEEKFSLTSGLISETFSVKSSGWHTSYMGEMPGKRYVQISLDPTGAPSGILFHLGDGVYISCDPKSTATTPSV